MRSGKLNAAHRVALEGLEGAVAAKATYMDAHVSAAGGKRGVVLPVDIQRWGCGTYECAQSLGVLQVGSSLSSTEQEAKPLQMYCSA